jgi:hypothetical protein
MPKPMMLHVAVEEAFYGKIFRALDTMPGVVSLNPVSEAHPQQAKAGKPDSIKNGSTAGCLVLAALIKAKRPMAKAELAEAMTTGGKKAATLPSTLQSLKSKRHVINAKGAWQITPTGVKFFGEKCGGQS